MAEAQRAAERRQATWAGSKLTVTAEVETSKFVPVLKPEELPKGALPLSLHSHSHTPARTTRSRQCTHIAGLERIRTLRSPPRLLPVMVSASQPTRTGTHHTRRGGGVQARVPSSLQLTTRASCCCGTATRCSLWSRDRPQRCVRVCVRMFCGAPPLRRGVLASKALSYTAKVPCSHRLWGSTTDRREAVLHGARRAHIRLASWTRA